MLEMCKGGFFMSLFENGGDTAFAEDTWDGNPQDLEGAYKHLLYTGLHGNFTVEDRVEKDSIFLPDWQLSITPEIQQLTGQSAVIGFYVYHPDWDKPLYECCASPGQDTKTAIGMSVGSFLFCFMQGLSLMFAKDSPLSLETDFAGTPHLFHAYLSDIVGMGDSPQVNNASAYWDLLKEDIAKRFGNQRFCYVKIYASKVNGEVIGECRINDVPSDELGAKIAEYIKDWEVSVFASHKQFFFLEQSPETLQPYPYWGEQGQKELIRKVITAVQLFHASDTQEAFDSLQERLTEVLGDATLAAECRLFLPEICAEHAGGRQQVQFGETLDILYPNREKITLYKHQLMDFYPMGNAMFRAFDQGIFGEETNDIYMELVGTSAISSALQQAMENGSQLENLHLTGLLYQVNEDFEIR